MSKHKKGLPVNDDIQRILVIKWSAMGDVVLATPIFEDLRKAFPNSEMHLNTLPIWAPLFEQDSRFSRIISIDVRKKGARWLNAWKWFKAVRSGHYDMVVDLQTTDRSAIMLGLIQLFAGGIRWRIGNIKRWPYNIAPHNMPAKTAHALTRHQAALEQAGIPAITPRPTLHVPQRNIDNARALQSQYNLKAGQYALFLPGCQAAGHLKRWGEDNYIGLAKRLHNTGLKHIVIIGAKDEVIECETIASACADYAVNLCGKTEILDIIPLAQDACLTVGNDTGTAHIAAASDRPMLVICGPTDPARVKPAGDNVISLQADLPCINCYCVRPCDHHSCMKLITPEMAHAALQELFKKRGYNCAGGTDMLKAFGRQSSNESVNENSIQTLTISSIDHSASRADL